MVIVGFAISGIVGFVLPAISGSVLMNVYFSLDTQIIATVFSIILAIGVMVFDVSSVHSAEILSGKFIYVFLVSGVSGVVLAIPFSKVRFNRKPDKRL